MEQIEIFFYIYFKIRNWYEIFYLILSIDILSVDNSKSDMN